MIWLYIVSGLLLLVAVYDVTQRKNSILHNFPVVGHLRYWLIKIGPELRQYIVAHNREEAPFNRLEREWIYTSSDRVNNYFAFGTDDEPYAIGYPIIKHAVFAHPNAWKVGNRKGERCPIPCAKVIGETHGRERPYRPPSIINISAMSFGSLGRNAIRALNLGAVRAGCFHNTGEGGVSRYHRMGADLCLQIGTGYFGARTSEGEFCIDTLRKTVDEVPAIRLIEIKLSQGAKPGRGGVLPAAKVTPEIAEARGVPVGEDCISPSVHRAFCTVDELIDFVERIADASGLPVGIKFAVGQINFFEELAARMRERNQGPDFLTIDGGEGGTGAAPLTFADHVSLPYKLGFSRVYKVFEAKGLADDLVWIGSGKLGFPDRTIVAMAMGADCINVAREAMLSIGCIQAQKCHTGHCPSGVATHSGWFQRGLVPEVNAKRFEAYLDAYRGEVMSVTLACGYSHPGEFTPHCIEISSGPNRFSTLHEILGYEKTRHRPAAE
ncbi:MAG: FMN-binding glutamate synthase family protein [Planctomycetota bacterium]|jgi:glutamate synthase (ferredoxin)